MSTPMVTLARHDRYSTGFTVEYDYGRSIKVTMTPTIDDNPAEFTTVVDIDELIAALAVVAARMDRS